MSAQTSLAHDLTQDLTDIIVSNNDDPFFTHSRTTSNPPTGSDPTDPEKALVASIERATLAIVFTGASLLIAALLGNGARPNVFAQDGTILCGAAAILSATVAIFSTVQSLARLLDLSPTHASGENLDRARSWDPP